MLPDSQLQKLRDDLAVHEKRLTALENSISAQQIEADVHRVVLKLGRDQGLLNLFGELYVHPELAQEAAKDPAGFAAKRGVTLPADARVTVGVDGAVQAELVQGSFHYLVQWDRHAGFSTAPVQMGMP